MDSAPPAPADGLLPGQRHIPALDEAQGKYRVRFARTEADLDAVLRLRFRVFNLELGEGLKTSFVTGRDEDVFDGQCQHLMVLTAEGDEVIGTYRLQVAENALAGAGFYSAGEFDLSALPDEVLAASVELGRACVDSEHRTKRALYMLWRGLAEYVVHNKKRSFFGCSSLSSQHQAEGMRFYEWLEQEQRVHPDLSVTPLSEFACAAPGDPPPGEDVPLVPVPPLFGIYLRHGAWILGPPAIDRQFGTIDYLTYLEVQEDHLRTFGGRQRG